MGFDGVERFSSVASTQVSRKISDGTHEQILNELASFLTLIDAFGSEADINHHASLTKQSRELKLQLNGDKTNQRTNELIEATERGSLCTRIMGAGGGGFFVCWAPKHKHQDIKESVKVKTWVDVKFSRTGSQVIFSE